MASSYRTALVTGASSGIGRAFVRALAREGTAVVAVARRRDRLEELAKELGEIRPGAGVASHALEEAGVGSMPERRDGAPAGATKPPAGIEPLAADLTEADQLARVEARLADPARPVDLLVNCAGFGTQGRFAQLPLDGEDRQVRLNVLAPVRLTRVALPGMLERRHGAVINVSSVAGHQPIPLWATYSASKAFLTTFSRAVAGELRGTSVRMMVLLPGFTYSEFHDHSGFERKLIPGPFWMSSEAVAEIALRDLRRGRVHSFPGVHNRVTAAASRMSPWALTRRVLRVATRSMW